MTEVIQITGYDWSGFWITLGITFAVIMVIAAIVCLFDGGDPFAFLPASGLFLILGVFILLAQSAFMDDHESSRQIAALKDLNYSNVEEADGYNQFTASDKDGKYVRLVLAHVPDGDNEYWVLEVKE